MQIPSSTYHCFTLLDSLEFFSFWKISLNPQKTQAAFFTKRHSPPPIRIKLYDTPIPWSPTSTYLGISFDKSLPWETHITITLRSKRLLYITILRPVSHMAPWSGQMLPLLTSKYLKPFNLKLSRSLLTAPGTLLWDVISKSLLSLIDSPL